MSVRDRWRAVQKRLGITADGNPVGRETVGAVEGMLGMLLPSPEDELDERSAANIATLNPKVQPAFRELVSLAKTVAARHGLDARAISGHRTWAEQDALYAKGRTKPGPRVTNAPGGWSNHNYGVALDLGLFRLRDYIDSTDPALAAFVHQAIAEEARAQGLRLKWGGDWRSFKDLPHWEFNTGLTLAQMRERVEDGGAIV